MAKTALKKKKVTLQFEGEPGKEIFVAGSFNDWTIEDHNKSKKTKKLKEAKGQDGHYSINMFLPQGEYEYKFFSESRWFADPQAETNKMNPFGTFNSVLCVA